MEIIQERLEREYDLDLITTAPSVVYRLKLTDGSEITIDNPTNYPDPTLIASAQEPICNAHIYSPRSMWATSWSCARSAGACSRT